MSSTTNSSYDRIPYEGFVLFQTHPDHLASLAQLFEVSPPSVETCTVLEVGCASGENLIPMAEFRCLGPTSSASTSPGARSRRVEPRSLLSV